MAEPVTGALDAAVLARQIADLQQAIADLKRGQRTVQLSRSSIDDGVLETRVGEALTSSWGRQPDGTNATVYAAGDPPPTPTAPIALGRELAFVVFYDGTFANGAAWPANVERVDIHVSDTTDFTPDLATGTTLYQSIIRGPGAAVIPADINTRYVKLVAVDNAGVASAPSAQVSVNPLGASDFAARSIGAEHLKAVLLLASTIIAGTQGGARVQLSATGFTKYGADNQPNITLGTTTSGDFLSITGPAPLTLTNYCPNPRLGVDASGWSATGAGTVTRVQATTIPGADAVYRVSNGSGTVTVSTPPAPVDPTVVATVFRRVEVRPAVTRTVTPQLTFRNSAGTVLATVTGADVSCLNGVATVVSVSADTVPSDTARVEMTVSYAAYTGATDLSRALCSTVNPGQYLGGVSYFDGASDGGMWSGTAGSSVSTVLTQTTDQVPLTSIDARGAVTAQALSVASREPVFGGVTLSDRVAASPGRVITYGQPLGSGQSTPGVSGTAPAESGFFTLAFTAQAGRLYRVCTSTVIADGSGTSNPTNVGFRVRYTLDGSTPTTASPLLTGTAITYSRGGHLNFLCTFDSAQVRLLLCTVKFDGATVFLRAPGGDLGMVAWVDDAGPNQGALSSASSTFSSAWGATWTRTFDATGVRSDTDLVQGQSLDSGSGLNRAMIGFNYSDIQTKLAGATITKVELYLYAYYWVSTSGGYVVVGTHNQAAAPAAYSQVSRSDLVQGMGRPAGAYLSLPTSVGVGLRDNTIKGVVLDATQRSNATDTMYTGKFRAVGQASAPILRITYTKPT